MVHAKMSLLWPYIPTPIKEASPLHHLVTHWEILRVEHVEPSSVRLLEGLALKRLET